MPCALLTDPLPANGTVTYHLCSRNSLKTYTKLASACCLRDGTLTVCTMVSSQLLCWEPQLQKNFNREPEHNQCSDWRKSHQVPLCTWVGRWPCSLYGLKQTRQSIAFSARELNTVVKPTKWSLALLNGQLTSKVSGITT